MAYNFGQGEIYLSLRSSTGVPTGFTFFGNCPSLSIELGRSASRFATGGTEVQTALVPRGASPMVRFSVDDFNLTPVSNLWYGRSTTINAGTTTNELITARLGRIVPFVNMNLTSAPVITAQGGSPTYTTPTDYSSVNLKHGSVTFPVSGSAITEGQILEVDYSFGAYDKISGFTMRPGYYWLRYEGWNITTNPYTPIVVDVYKIMFKPFAEWPLITDDLSVLEVEATLHRDSTQPDTTTDGKYFRLRRYDA